MHDFELWIMDYEDGKMRKIGDYAGIKAGSNCRLAADSTAWCYFQLGGPDQRDRPDPGQVTRHWIADADGNSGFELMFELRAQMYEIGWATSSPPLRQWQPEF